MPYLNYWHPTLFILVLFLVNVTSFLPAQNPKWLPTYNMSLSTATTGMNETGFIDPKLAGQWGLVFYDWSNAKQFWCNAKPMNCEELLVQQADMTKSANPNTKVFVYRNLVKALPWYTSVREKLDDPAYSGFFLKFKPGGFFPNGTYHVPKCTFEKCSGFYHDQEQTPQVPSKDNPDPDGICYTECDCGGNPCGEYLFDHRNGSMLTQWLLDHHIFGPTGLDNPNIDGLFIDDFWCSNILNGSKTCTDPVQGPTEIDRYNQVDMGLSDGDILDLTKGWLMNMEQVQQDTVNVNKFTWSLFPGQQNANLMPFLITNSTCNSSLSQYCNTNHWNELPLILGVEPDKNNPRNFPSLIQSVASFLLLRGPYAWITHGTWGIGWPWDIPRPVEFDTDYGEPLDPYCKSSGDGVFTRHYSNVFVSVNCTDWTASITPN